MGKKSWGKRINLGGHQFRSSWEAYICVLFWASNIQFRYETKRYYLPNTDLSYLPDFYLPEYKVFIEVKGYYKEKDKIKTLYFKQYYTPRLIFITESEVEKIYGRDAGELPRLNFAKYSPSVQELDRFHTFLREQIKNLNKVVTNDRF